MTVDAPVERVFAFHERDDALELLTPRFPPVRVIQKSGGIQSGARVELKVGPLRWLALHTEYVKNRLFVDEQTAGPFAKWIHRHEFAELNGKTTLTDNVEYRLKGGTVADALLGWVVQAMLKRMFAHRHRVTKKWCERAGR